MAVAIPLIMAAAASSTAAAAGATLVGATAAEVAASGVAEGITWSGVAAGEAASEAALSAASTASLLANGGALIGAAGQVVNGISQSNAAKTNAKIQAANAGIAENNANYTAEVGEVNAAKAEMKTRQEMGGVIAAQGASGIDVNSGSAVQVQSSVAQQGQLDALTIRGNASKAAYGYQTQAAGDTFQAELDKNQATNSEIAGGVGAATTFLGGELSADANYQKYLSTGGSPFAGGGGWVL